MDQHHEGSGNSSSADDNRFGRGWIPAERDIGIPGEDLVAAHSTFTPERRVRFLDHLAGHGNVRAACAAVGISAEAAYRARRRDRVFGEAWAAALVVARGAVEQVLADRAVHGVEEQIWYRGELVGSRRRYDGRLLLAHLARLDRLAAAEPAATRACRFDELLALVAGETFAGDMADQDDGWHHRADPLLPMERVRYLEEAGERAAADGRDVAIEAVFAAREADGADDAEWRAMLDPETLLGSEEIAALDEAEALAAERGRTRAVAAWDDWQTRADAAAAIAGGGEGAPIEFKSLDPVNPVNTWPVNTGGAGSTLAAAPLYKRAAPAHPRRAASRERSACLQPATPSLPS